MIELVNISKKFGEVDVFSDVNYTFEKGKAYGLTGRNGSGKSVLLRLIAGFSKPDSGYVRIDGEKLGDKFDFIQNAGVSINKTEFIGHWSGYDNLLYLASIRHLITSDEIMEWVEKLGLEKDIKRPYRSYSQGMRQKMRIIQAVMEQPQILLMDEPFNALDEESVKIVQNVFMAFKRENRLFIFTSHDRDDIERLSDVILSIDEIKSKYKS